MEKVLDVQCPFCKAPIHFDAKLGKLKCEYCDSVISPEDLKKIENVLVQESISEEDIKENYVAYNCPDCGAEIVADENTAATFCLYCGNTAIIKNKITGAFAPDKIIPFKKDKEEAVKAFKELSKGRPLVPASFNSSKNIEKITGLYIPFWLYEVSVSGRLEADATKVTSWSVGDTHYTKKDFYKLVRDGKMAYKRVPVDGSLKFDNDLMNALEPFYFHYLVDFNHAYLSGFYAEKYDVSKEDAFIDAEKRVLESTKDVMLNDMGNYASKKISQNALKANKTNVEYVLLPVWMVNVKYKDKYYMFAMNGQTGEFVGNIPLDKKKLVLYALLSFVITFIIVMAVFYMLYSFGGNA